MSGTTDKAILAGGCFWGMQDLIRKRPGVLYSTPRAYVHRGAMSAWSYPRVWSNT